MALRHVIKIGRAPSRQAPTKSDTAPPFKLVGSPLPHVQVERHDDVFLASLPAVGAVSALSPLDFVAFHFFLNDPHDDAGLTRLYAEAGESKAAAAGRAATFAKRLERDGWLRTSPPSPDSAERLRSVYFTITRECDLACSYCYQGLRERPGKEMPLEKAHVALEKIAAFNPGCHVIVTGGEPFKHPQVFAIFDKLEALGLAFGTLCNGTFIDAAAADRLSGYVNLKRIQVSLDGMTNEVHALTRGPHNFPMAMRAIDLLLERGLPVIVAPTIHQGNAHQISEMAIFAAQRGAYFSPNNLREFPHDENHGKVSLPNATLDRVIAEFRTAVREKFSTDYLLSIERRFKSPAVCSVSEPNANFICGTGHSLLDIDWNGEVYPCHLLKDRSLILGNAFDQSFEAIFGMSRALGIRVPSTEIEKCGSCKFNSRCGGGCRAGAYFTYGSLAREDSTCSVNYSNQLHRLLQEA